MATYKKKSDEELKAMCPTCKNYFIKVNGNMTYCCTECRTVGNVKKSNEKWMKDEKIARSAWKR